MIFSPSLKKTSKETLKSLGVDIVFDLVNCLNTDISLPAFQAYIRRIISSKDFYLVEKTLTTAPMVESYDVGN